MNVTFCKRCPHASSGEYSRHHPGDAQKNVNVNDIPEVRGTSEPRVEQASRCLSVRGLQRKGPRLTVHVRRGRRCLTATRVPVTSTLKCTKMRVATAALQRWRRLPLCMQTATRAAVMWTRKCTRMRVAIAALQTWRRLGSLHANHQSRGATIAANLVIILLPARSRARTTSSRGTARTGALIKFAAGAIKRAT